MDTTGGGTDFTTPKGGLFGALVTAPTGTDVNTLNTAATLAGMRWMSDLAGTAVAANITYFFPTSAADYTAVAGYPDTAELATFAQVSAQQQQIILASLAMVASYTNVTFTQAANGLATAATLRFSAYTPAMAGSEARFPTNNGPYQSSDARSAGENFEGQNAIVPAGSPIWGTDAFATIAHELGHSIGLKHGHDNSFNGALSAARNDNEFSIMTYASYLGTNTASPSEARLGSSPLGFMMYDISALQYMYGANYSGVGTARTYSWDAMTGQENINGIAAANTGVTATNKIFSTVWTNGAATTYDLSNFNDNGMLDLRPGNFLKFSNAQIADLNSAAAAGTAQFQAQGNIYNALLYNNDTRSEIANLITGNGNNTIFGDDIFNMITLGSGDNSVTSGAGGANVVMGAGKDTVQGAGAITADYAKLATGIFADLSGGYAVKNSVTNLTDILTGVTNIAGTNNLYTAGGYYSDFLTGATAGGTTFYGLGGNDLITGKGTNNTTSYARDAANGGAAGVYVDLRDGTAGATGGVGRDGYGTYDSLVNIQNIVGTNSAFAPGNYFSDLLYGLNGGGSTLFGLGGNDYLVGRGTNNTDDYSLDAAFGGAAGVFVDLSKSFARDGFGAFDGLLGLQNVTGTAANDFLYGDAGDNVLRGGRGSDYLDGGAGNDTIVTNRVDMAANDLDVMNNWHVGDVLRFSLDLQGNVGFRQDAANVTAFAAIGTGYWAMSIQNAALANVTANGAVVYV